MTEIVTIPEIYDPNNAAHVRGAIQLAELQREAGSAMLPLNPDVLKSHPLGYIALDQDTGDFMGYNAVTREYPENGFIEIGGLFVHPGFKGRKREVWLPIKRQLFADVRKLYAGQSAIIFANPSSYRLNVEDCKFRDVTPDDPIPPASLTVCETECDKFCTAQAAGRFCCDSLVIQKVDDLPLLDD